MSLCRSLSLLAAAGLLAVAPAASAQQVAPARRVLPPINYTEYKLPNGLRVILHQDRSTPIVAVNVWYHVGSKNEVSGRTGFAHLFEHMMFQGSKNYPNDYFSLLQEAGGSANGSTNPDRTNYWEVVPSNFLELALSLEADRMGGLLEAMTEAKLANQRDVVKNEKRQNYDNRPYGLVGAKINERLYPADHPYHWLTIGALEDLTAASMDDVKGFFRRYYVPNNASLAIAGDFDMATARRMVEKHFASVPKGAPIPPVKVTQPIITEEIRMTMEDRVALPRLYMVWHTKPRFSAEEAPLDVAAYVLGGGKTSRLYKTLVYDRQIAQDVSAFNNAGELAGRFQITATAKPGKTLEELESAIKEEIAKLQAAPPTTEEMARAYNDVESSFIYGLQTVGGFGGKSDQLNQYAIMRGTPGWFEQDLARARAVRPARVQALARQFLTDKRLIMTVTPRAKNAPPAVMAAATAAGTPPAAAGAPVAAAAPKPLVEPKTLSATVSQPPAGPTPTFKLPTIQRRKLKNGLDVLIVEHHELPVVGMNLVVKGGTAADSGVAGLASLTADMLDEGTTTRSSLQLSADVAAIGARLRTGAFSDASGVEMQTLTRHLDKALGIFADVVLNPAFPTADLQRLRATRLAALAQRRDDANIVAGNVYASLLYGAAHPYGRSGFGEKASLEAIAEAHVKRYHDTFYRPNNATLIVVGDVKPDMVVAKLEKALGNWKAGAVPAIDLSVPPPRDKSVIYLVDKPGAAQSVISIGQVGVERATPDYYPLLVLNTMLGGQFMSRVNLNLRENKGYSYGARTQFDYRRGAGPFVATAGVQTAVTKESVIEFMKELRGIRGEIPVTDAELETAKQSLIRGFPRGFETPEQIAGRLSEVALYGLADNYFDSYVSGVADVTRDELMRVANKYLDPSRMAILVVGDRSVIEPGLKSLEGIGATVTVLDAEGKPVEGGGTK